MTTQCALLVIGSGPGGVAAAEAFREAGGEGTVQIVSSDPRPPYHRPPLSKDFLRGECEADALALGEESSYAEQEIELVLGRTAVHLDAGRRFVRLDNGEEVSYDACVLALGSTPVVPPIDGLDSPDVFLLRSLDDAERLRSAVEDAKSAIVIGSGFIGCEAAVSLASRGLEVTLVSQERLPQADRLGDEVAGRIAGWLREAGVTLLGGVTIDGIDGGRAVVINDRPLPADLILLAAGVHPSTEFVAEAGVEVADGRVVVDEHLAAPMPRLYAVGDTAHAKHAVAGEQLDVEHWDDAEAMGAIAGANAAAVLAGNEPEKTWDTVPGFWSDIGEHTISYAGWGGDHDAVRLVDHGDGAFTVWYTRDVQTKPIVVGVLTHDADDDLDRGRAMIAAGDELPEGDIDHEATDFTEEGELEETD